MKNFMEFNKFIEVVKKYAEAYQELEEIASYMEFIPSAGDQKTGVLGEAYIFKYLQRQGHPDVEFGNAAQKGWDIKYPFGLAPNGVVLVQVKTVSAFSKTKAISPIHFAPDYCELFLVSLNRNFIPDVVWKPTGYNPAKIKVKNGEKVVMGTKMPRHETDTASGFTGLENITEDFKNAFPELYRR